MLVYRLVLSLRDSRPLALECPVLALQSAAPRAGRSAAQALRVVAARLRSGLPEESVRRLQQEVLTTLDAAAALDERRRHVRRTREEAIARLRGSTASQLVQAGLFDRRALKEVASRKTRDRQVLDEQAVRLQQVLPGLPVSVDLVLKAILRIFVRRGRR